MRKDKFVSHVFFFVFWITCTYCERPNIVIFLADDMGIGDVGSFGNKTIATPNIDRLAREGVKLMHHMAADSVCTPSRAALLTGRYPIRAGLANKLRVIQVLGGAAGLPTDETTLAELAKQAGYSTALIGKWHLGLFDMWRNFTYHPLNHGFDIFYGLPFSNLEDNSEDGGHDYFPLKTFIPQVTLLYILIVLPSVRLCTVVGFSYRTIGVLLAIFTAVYIYHYGNLYERGSFQAVLMRGYDVTEQPVRLKGLTRRFVNESVDYLERRQRDGSPFLLYVAWHYTHTHLDPAEPFSGSTGHGRYGDCVVELDWGTGQILDTLDRLGMTNNTLVYFTSDHGGHIELMDGGYNGIYKGGKGWGAANGGIMTPGLIRWPGHVTPNTEIRHPTSLMDIFPTVAEILNVSVPADVHIDGHSLLPLIRENRSRIDERFFMHYCGSNLMAVTFHTNEDTLWKIAYNFPDATITTEDCVKKPPYIKNVCSCSMALPRDPPWLFDLQADPGEHAPLDIRSTEKFRLIERSVETAVREHKRSLSGREMLSLLSSNIWLPHLQPCCNFPTCRCTEDK